MNAIINWMGGWPKNGLVSGVDWEERLTAAVERGMDNHTEKLKEQLAQGILKARTDGDSSVIQLTKGADEALLWVITRFLKQGDTILTERVTSRSALHAFRKAGVQIMVVPSDPEGMEPKELAAAISVYQPKLVYASPDCSDPEGLSWSRTRYHRIKQQCQEAGVLLLTDDRQEMLVFEAQDPNTLNKQVENGVLSIGQIPPGLITGLQLGWVIGAQEYLQTMDKVSQRIMNGNELTRRALSQLIEEQPLEPLLEMLRIQCEVRMKRITQLMQHLQEHISWVEPHGGLHLWVTLPAGLDGESLLRGAWLKGLIFQPGAPFFAHEPRANTLRLTYAFADEQEMKTGVLRLGESMEEFTGRWTGD